MSEILDPAVAEACAFLQGRSEVGLRKYGGTVRESPDDMEEHAREELADLLVYWTELKRRRDMERRNVADGMKALCDCITKLKRDVAALREAGKSVLRDCAYHDQSGARRFADAVIAMEEALAATEPKEEA